MAFTPEPPESAINVGTVQFVFIGKRCAGQPTDSFPDHYTSKVTVGDGDSVETFKSTALAYYNAPTSGDPTNKSVLDALASQFANDWMSWKQTQAEQVLVGVAEIAPTGLYDVEWDLGSAKIRTRLTSGPFNFHVQELGHYDWTDDCSLTATPCLYFFGPPGSCNNGHLQLTRWKLCLADGRISQSYVSTDNLT